MRTTYKVLAYTICVLVGVQAASHAWASAGLGSWVEGGGVLDSTAFESDESLFPEMAGFGIHAMNGMMIIPFVSLILLVIALISRTRKAMQWAGLVLLLVGVQIFLGFASFGVAALAILHGLNALALFTCALTAGRIGMRVDAPAVAAAAPAVEGS
ncbi:hypothetical protein [Demequina sp.]|uniref:hypothetical protein n=1 Tax=Demequina sp. TaxID=2050685 RepID=UPI0025CBA950|nr:hypothetical protein [Demequina sp.]